MASFEDPLEAGLGSSAVLDAFHPTIENSDNLNENKDQASFASQNSHNNEKIIAQFYFVAGFGFLLISATILLMSPFSLSKIAPSSDIFLLLLTHSSGLFGGVFISNALGIGSLYILSKYASLFVYFLSTMLIVLWTGCCWMIFLLSASKLISVLVFIIPIAFGIVYKNIPKAIPQAIKVAQLTCTVARSNLYYLSIIFFMCQVISLVFSGIWFIIFSHSLLLGFYHTRQPTLYLFNPTSFLVGIFLLFFYYWTSAIIGNIQRMLTAFVVIEWWKSHSSELEKNTSESTGSSLKAGASPGTEILNDSQRKDDFLLDLTDWIFWLWENVSIQICTFSLITSLFSVVELVLHLFAKIWSFTIGMFWMPFFISSSNSVLQRTLEYLRQKIAISSPLTLLNLIKQSGFGSVQNLSSSHSQIQRILHQQQVHVVAPGVLHLLLDLCTLILSALLALIAVINRDSIKLSTAFFGISVYWIVGSAVNKSLFRMVRDIADCILLCHIRSADGCVLGHS